MRSLRAVAVVALVALAVAFVATALDPFARAPAAAADPADPYRHPFVTAARLQAIDKDVRARVAAMSTLAKAKHLDMYHGAEFLTNGTLDLAKARGVFGAEGVGIVHDLYAPTTDVVNALQRLAVEQTVPQIPLLFLEECLHGVNQMDKTIFPNPLALGASWRPDLVRRVGAAIGTEARAFGIRQCLSPVLGAAREPRWGRVEELFAEDAHLIAALAYGYVTGMQGTRVDNLTVVAEPKHYAAHSIPESGLNTGPAHVGRRELEEVFLPPFEAAVAGAGALGIMAAYSEIDGVPCAANAWTLTETLRDRWGFQGFVLSDLGAVSMLQYTHRIAVWPYQAIAAYLTAGGNCQFYDYPHDVWNDAIVNGVANGSLSQDVLDQRVTEVLRVKSLLQLFDQPYTDDTLVAQWVDTPATRQLALDAARAGMVLLQNNGSLLPLDAATLPALGVAGMTAFQQMTADYAGGGGNANNYNFVTLVEALYDFVGGGNATTTTTGDGGDGGEALAEEEVVSRPASAERGRGGAGQPALYPVWGSTALHPADVEPIHRTYLLPYEGATVQGVTGEYFDNLWLEGEPSLTRIDAEVNFQFYHWHYDARTHPWTAPDANHFSVRWTGLIVPDVTCPDALLSLQVDNGGARLTIDGALVIDAGNCTTGCTRTAPFGFVAGTRYPFRVDWTNKTDDAKLFLSWNLVGQTAGGRVGIDRAVATAKHVHALGGVMLVAVGDNLASSGEGRDRLSLDLPGQQAALVSAVAATGVPTVVVLFSGRHPSIPQVVGQAQAILEAYGPGQAGGRAIVETLFGANVPGGKLPLTYPKSVGQVPVFYNRKPSARYNAYVDGDRDPVFPFGHGLSYAEFAYTDLVVAPAVLTDPATTHVSVSVTVTNNGTRGFAGDEVVQLYVRDDVASVTTPIRELRQWSRITLAPGQAQRVTLDLQVPRDLWVFDPRQRFVVENGNFTVWVGSSSADLRLNATLVVDLPPPTADARAGGGRRKLHVVQTEMAPL